jgi:uroporphyrinogen decarboxylase
VRRFDIDACIIFQDILNLAEAMGMEVVMEAGKGPCFPNPLKTPEDLARLKPALTSEIDYFYDALFETRH